VPGAVTVATGALVALGAFAVPAPGLAQGLAFGVMNSAWALGNVTGPVAGGALASAFGDAVPYLLGAALCALTLVATQGIAGGRMRTA